MTRRIDAHQHFWRLMRGDYRWLTPDAKTLYRDFAPADLLPHLREHRIDATVLVQAADSLAETQFLLALAEGHDFIAGVVGWVDFESPDAVDHLGALAEHPSFVGVRPMLQDITDDRWVLRTELEPVFRALVELELAFDALVKPRHLEHVLRLMERHPDLRLVIDHGAKPAVAEGRGWNGFRRWSEELGELARHPQVHCKVSGLVTEASPAWQSGDLAPFLDELSLRFGLERLMWGSDWPVVELARGYDAWMAATEQWTRQMAPVQKDALLGANAEFFYGLRKTRST